MTRERITRERVTSEPPLRQRTVETRTFRERELSDRQIILRKITRFVWWATGVVEGLIALRVVLRMMAANPGNPFANFIYAITDLFLWPFQTLVANPSSDGIVLEISSVIAMMVYLIMAWIVVELVWLIMGRERV
jgi:YggT family protein